MSNSTPSRLAILVIGLVILLFGAIPCLGAVAVPPVYSQLKDLHIDTEIVSNGKPKSVIVVPASGLYEGEARKIQEVILERTGVEIPVVTDDDPRAAANIPVYWTGPRTLKTGQTRADSCLTSNLIVLGNRSTNKTISTLYNLYFTLLDLKYPGAGGYEVRTLHSPFGDGKNIIFVGGSDSAGVAQAAEAFVLKVNEAPAAGGKLSMGWIMDIKLGAGMKVPKQLSQVETWEASVGYGSLGYFGWNSISKCMALYYMTGDPQYVREFLRFAFPDEATKRELATTDGEMIENKDDPLAGPYHYNAHMMILFWDLIEESPVFTDAERLRVTNAFSRQLSHRAGEGIFSQGVPTSVGDRHTQWSAVSLYTLGRYFQKEYGDRVWNWAVYGALNHFGALHKHACVALENDNLYWYNTMIAPILTYLVMTGDRVPVENGVLDQLLRAQEMLISGQRPDWALEYASLEYLHKAAYLTGDGRWIRYRERTGMNTDTFRLGQSFWPEENLQPSDPTDLVGKWSIRYLLPLEWERREDGLRLAESFSYGSFRSTADHTGDYILIDGFNGAARNPYHTFAVLELRLNGDTLLQGYNNQLQTKTDGMVDSHIAMNAALKFADMLGGSAAVVAEVPNAPNSSWRRSLIQRVGKYALFVDGLLFREDSRNTEVQLTWELGLSRGGTRPIRTSQPMRTTLTGQMVTMQWYGEVQRGQHKQFFTLLGVPTGECYAVSENAAALALPEPALALVGQFGSVKAQVAVLASDHLFGIQLSRAGLEETWLEASSPVEIDWDYASGILEITAERDVVLSLALDAPRVTLDGKDINLERTPDGKAKLVLTAGRHYVQGVRLRASTLASMQKELATLLAQGKAIRSAATSTAQNKTTQPKVPALHSVMTGHAGAEIRDMTIISSSDGELIAVGAGKMISMFALDGELVRRIYTEGDIRLLRWWPEHQLLLVGCVDEKVIAYDSKGQRQWVFTSEMDPAVYRAGKQYWFKSWPGQNGIHGLYTGVFIDGKSQAFVGSACTIEIIDEHGKLIRRMPVFWGLSSVFNIVEGPNDSLNLLAARKHNGDNNVAIINNKVLSAVPRGFNSVPPGATYVGGWSAMNRHHIFYEDLAGDGEKVVITDINGVYNRVTVWEVTGNQALYDASFGPGPDYTGRGWRQEEYDTRNIRDMSIADLDGDGKQEVIVGLWSGYVVALDHQLNRVWSMRLSSPPSVVGIVQSQGMTTAHIVVGSQNGTISVLNHEGQIIRSGFMMGVPTFVECVENDGSTVIVVGANNGRICGFSVD